MRIRTLALTGAAAVLLTACGGGGSKEAVSTPTPPGDPRTGMEIVEDAANALHEAGAVRIRGSFPDDGRKTRMDMQLQDDGATGTMTTDGQTAELLRVGEAAYLKAEAEWWQSLGYPEAAVGLVSDRWLLMPTEQAGGLGPVVLGPFIKELFESLGSPIEEEVEIGQVDGQDVLIVSTGNGTLSVLAGEDSYPIRLESTDEEPVRMELSDFGKRQELEPPADFLDLADLGG